MTKWTLAITLLISSVLALGHPVLAEAPHPVEKPVTAHFRATSDPLDAWLDRLIQKESNGSTTVVIVDTNGYRSYGCLQFQRRTFEAYSKKFDMEGDILDCDFQKALARRMLESGPREWRHWYTSVALKGLGLPPVR